MGNGARRTRPAVVLIAWLTFFGTAAAQDCGEQWVGRMASAEGPSIEVRRAGGDRWLTAGMNDTFCAGDTLRVGPASRANLVLSNQSLLRIDQNTELKLEAIREQSTALLDLVKGAIHFLSRTIRGAEVRTRYTIAGVRGTEFLMRVEDGRAWVIVYEGAVLAQNPAGSLTLKGGQAALVEEGQPPVLTAIARPRDAVQWALHYPPVLYAAPGAPLKEDSRRWAAEASHLLAVGRVEEADDRIERALALDPASADALALKTIILVVANQRELAMAAAQRAVSADPSSATARVALSYARQAEFDLESARDSLQEAVTLEPGNALAWARLSELQMSLGHLDRALASARRAVALDPALSRTQSVLGFAHLAQVETEAARAAFDKAIALDQGDPLPRLGMGLAIIREGRLEEGGRQIEIAASLDPNNSIVRSYLGKTYYEEKRTGLDQREYATAKELDPRDPTPFFYDAIAKQTTNRPVEALEEYQKAIELNDNRAIYRSKLYLDADLAARSATMARVYGDLGFRQRAILEGYRSVNIDPTNFSAHRFLADSVSALPRREIARVSELLQSQLLQPINITPIQPALGQSNLYLLSSAGPGSVGFNEFNHLFNQNRAVVQASALAGENSTWGAEGIASAVYDKYSFSVGTTHFQTDGFRTNNDQKDDISNVFGQAQLSYKTSLQAEYRHRLLELGDTQLRFFENEFLPYLHQKDETNSIRIGGRHEFAPGSILIGNVSYQNANRKLSDRYFDTTFVPPLEGYFNQKANDSGFSGEAQYLFRSQHLNAVAGGGYFSVNQEFDTQQQIFDPSVSPPFLVDSFKEKIPYDISQTNFYLYTYPHWQGLTLTLGASADFYKEDEQHRSDRDLDKNQLNPKFGIAWNALTDTTLRAAAFRTLKRTLLVDQTIEPTQVAGFNQFYDDFNGTEAWNYGVGVDQKFTSNLFAGVEGIKRDLSVPYLSAPTFPATQYQLGNVDWKEYIARAYLYWAPLNWMSLAAEYQYEQYRRDEEFMYYIKRLDTHRVPLGINLFHPSGLSLHLKTTYVDQKGDFETSATLPGDTVSGSDSFWLVDVALSYRLPNRYGILTAGVRNLFDESFKYFDTDARNPIYQPDRVAYVSATIELP